MITPERRIHRGKRSQNNRKPVLYVRKESKSNRVARFMVVCFSLVLKIYVVIGDELASSLEQPQKH